MAAHFGQRDAFDGDEITPGGAAVLPQSPVKPLAATHMRSATPRKAATPGGVGYKPRFKQTPREPQPPKKRHIAVAIIAIVAAVAIIGGIILAVSSLGGGSDAPEQTPMAEGLVEVEIPEGAGGDVIAQRLVDAGLIKDAKTYYTAVANQKADMLLKPGTYEFQAPISADDIVKQLIAGPNSQKGLLRVAEGLTVSQTAAAVEAALGIPASDFMAQAKASNYVADYPFLEGVADDSLEGYLWGATYNFAGKDVNADMVIRAMLTNFKDKTASIDFSAGEEAIANTYGITMSNYDIIKMASIIEREGYTDDDRPLVSSVFYNRLRDDMLLQSDATMMYVTGGEVTAEDLKTDSPYNSYLYKGLPPTPICNPSIESLQAALNPASTNYYYFLLIENGSYSNHTFSETYEQHQAAIEQAKKDQGL